MADRVILGKGRNTGGTDYGLWVSKPGKDVKTCDPEDLMFDSNNRKYGEILAAGTFTGSTSVQVQMPNNDPPFVFTRSLNSLGGYTLGGSFGVNVSYSFSGTVCTVNLSTGASQTAVYIIISLGI